MAGVTTMAIGFNLKMVKICLRDEKWFWRQIALGTLVDIKLQMNSKTPMGLYLRILMALNSRSGLV